jgi:polyhydroxyalkanoate synthesis regulator phasin
LNKADRRIAELDRIIKRIYEDHIAEKLSDERFTKMLADYELEQAELSQGAEILRNEVEELRRSVANIKSFMDIVGRFIEIPELTADIARSFIDKVLIHEATFEDSKWGRFHQSRLQEITVVFNCIGEFKAE